MSIRPEEPGDASAIHAVHAAAFRTDTEARLVDRLRRDHSLTISLIAQHHDAIIGHVAFSPVTIVRDDVIIEDGTALGLGPIAVLPQHQRRGVGSSLLRAGLKACRQRNTPFIVVLGHPDYSPRFGFVRASSASLRNEYGVDEPFMVLELKPSGIPAGGGLIRYAPAFSSLDSS